MTRGVRLGRPAGTERTGRSLARCVVPCGLFLLAVLGGCTIDVATDLESTGSVDQIDLLPVGMSCLARAGNDTGEFGGSVCIGTEIRDGEIIRLIEADGLAGGSTLTFESGHVVHETIDGSGSVRLELDGQIAEDALRVSGTWWDGESLDIVAEDGEERTSADVLDYLGA